MRLGPIVGATLIVRDLQRSIDAYVDILGLVLRLCDRLPKQRALDMGETALIDAPRAQLRCPADAEADSWLTLIEAAHAQPALAYERRGCLALALPVTNLDVLCQRLNGSAFELAPGADNGPFQNSRRAQAIIGPSGELIYLLELESQSTGSSLPAYQVDRPCTVVIGAQQAATALGFYEGLGLLGRTHTNWSPGSLERGGPNGESRGLAIAQLAGAHTVLIDEVPFLPPADSALRLGFRLISFTRSDARKRLAAADDPSARILAGPAGEAIELL